MTAEVGIINQRGIALAADSAVTINGNKVTNSAVKLFTLDSSHYVGIMIYGNADLQSVPWEVIIKAYREKLKNNTFKKLKDYVNDFQKYIASLNLWGSKEIQWVMVCKYTYTIINTIKPLMEENKSIKLDDAIAETEKLVQQKEKTFDIDEQKVFSAFRDRILTEFRKNFPDISESQLSDCVDLVKQCLTSNYTPNDYTGIVFAGYGEKEMFPSIFSFQVDGIINGRMKTSGFTEITSNPLKNKGFASIIPFAQSDVMATVINGIAPELNAFRKQQLQQLSTTIVGCFPEDKQDTVKSIFDNYDRLFDAHSQQEYVSPITSMLNSLSVSELGSMAEMLVNLTAFKRKFSNDIGTVGGPIDVLTISKGEGPTWIKRKEYFNKDLNEGYKLRRR